MKKWKLAVMKFISKNVLPMLFLSFSLPQYCKMHMTSSTEGTSSVLHACRTTHHASVSFWKVQHASSKAHHAQVSLQDSRRGMYFPTSSHQHFQPSLGRADLLHPHRSPPVIGRYKSCSLEEGPISAIQRHNQGISHVCKSCW